MFIVSSGDVLIKIDTKHQARNKALRSDKFSVSPAEKHFSEAVF